MAGKYIAGDTAYIIESNVKVREVVVVKCSGGFCTIRFTDQNGGTNLRTDRLFKSREAAEEMLSAIKRQKKLYRM